MTLPRTGKKVKSLRRMGAYALYRVRRSDDELAKADLSALRFAVGLVEQLREELTAGEYESLVNRAEARNVKFGVPRRRVET